MAVLSLLGSLAAIGAALWLLSLPVLALFFVAAFVALIASSWAAWRRSHPKEPTPAPSPEPEPEPVVLGGGRPRFRFGSRPYEVYRLDGDLVLAVWHEAPDDEAAWMARYGIGEPDPGLRGYVLKGDPGFNDRDVLRAVRVTPDEAAALPLLDPKTTRDDDKGMSLALLRAKCLMIDDALADQDAERGR